jgi:mRNA interferase MazF
MDLERGSVIVCVSNGDYGKPRPAVVVQSNLFNATHASITVCPITTHIIEAPLFRLLISPSQENGLKQISQVMIDKITSIQREKISKKIGILSKEQLNQLNLAMKMWLNLDLNSSPAGKRLFLQETEHQYK